MKLDIHQRFALSWLVSAPIALSPLLKASTRPDVGSVLALGIVVVTACIAGCPVLLRWSLFRRWFCWTDAFSASQRTALEQRSLQRYYQAASEGGYVARIKPYVFRICAACAAIMAAGQCVHGNAEIVLMFASWYPVGVLLLTLASLPLPSLIRRRSGGKA